MMRTEASKRPCTFGNTAGIHEFTNSVFMSLVIRPFRNITASAPLTSRRPREERSITPAPPSRTEEYSFGACVSVSMDGSKLARLRRLMCGKPMAFRWATFRSSRLCLKGRGGASERKTRESERQSLSAHQAAEPQELFRFANSPHHPRHHLIILQLSFFVPAGDQNLWAGMVKRHQQTAIPATNPACVILQSELMIVKQFQRLERNCPQRYYNGGLDQLNSPPQKPRTVSNFRGLWPAIRA